MYYRTKGYLSTIMVKQSYIWEQFNIHCVPFCNNCVLPIHRLLYRFFFFQITGYISMHLYFFLDRCLRLG